MITLQLLIAPFLLPPLPLVLTILDLVHGKSFFDDRVVLSSIFVHVHAKPHWQV